MARKKAAPSTNPATVPEVVMGVRIPGPLVARLDALAGAMEKASGLGGAASVSRSQVIRRAIELGAEQLEKQFKR